MTTHHHHPDTHADAQHFADLAQGRADRARLCADRAASAANGAESLRQVAQEHVEMACAYARAAQNAYTAARAATAPNPHPDHSARPMISGIAIGFGLAVLLYLIVAILVRDLTPAPPTPLHPTQSVQHSVPAGDRDGPTNSAPEESHDL